jgi:uncharacterized protein YfeS
MKINNELLTKMLENYLEDKMDNMKKELPKIDLENIKEDDYIVMKDLDTNEIVKITYYHYKNIKLMGRLPENHAIIEVLQN